MEVESEIKFGFGFGFLVEAETGAHKQGNPLSYL